MKKLFCLLVMLAVVMGAITGCGGAEVEKTATEANVETEIIVTEEPTTVPTEPKTLFEEQGYVLWEEWQQSEGYGTMGAEDEAISMYVSSGETRMFGSDMIVYEWNTSDFEESYEHITDLVDSSVVVRIFEFASDTFETPMVSEMTNSFYEAYNKNTKTRSSKVDWLEAHKDYVIKQLYIQIDVASTSFFQNAINQIGKNYAYLSFVQNPSIVDMNTNISYYPPDVVDTMINFTVNTDSGEKDIYAYNMYHAIFDDASGYPGDAHWNIILYVWMPADYEELAFAWPVPTEKRTTEEWVEYFSASEIKDWKVQDLTEVVEENPRYKYYFFQ